MKVIDLFGDDLNEACIELSGKIRKEDVDLIVGVAIGGEYIAAKLAEIFGVPLLLIKKRRPLTSKKGKFKKIAPFFPKIILNAFRIIESKIYEWRFNDKWDDESDDVRFASDNIPDLFDKNVRSVLLADDSIDSGQTMMDCKQFLLNLRPDIKIKIAALTQTFKNPLIEADYKIYDRVLVRYPWSNDARKQQTVR